MMDVALGAVDWETLALIVLAQCTLVTLLALFAAQLFRRAASTRRAALQYCVAIALVCPLATFVLQSRGLIAFTIRAPATLQRMEAPPPARFVDAAARDESPVDRDSAPTAIQFAASTRADTDATASIVAAEVDTLTSTPRASWATIWRGTRTWLGEHGLVLLGALWLLGFAAGVLGVVRSWFNVRRMIRGAEPISNAVLDAATESARRELGLRRFPKVLASEQIFSPVAVGVRRPVVVLPAGLCERMSVAELRMVLLHEGAHVVQKDQLGLLIQRLFISMYWFHPLCHLAARQLSRSREEVCDNYVLNAVDGPSYGEALLRLTRLTSSAAPLAGGAGLFSLRWKLEQRISGLLDERRTTMVRTSIYLRAVLGAALLTAVAAIGATKMSAAQDESKSDPPPPVEQQRTGADPLTAKTGERQQVVAQVNGEKITIRQLAQRVLDEHGESALDSLVNRKILEQTATNAGVKVSEKDIDAEVERTAKKLGLKPDEFYNTIEKQRGIKRGQYRQDIVWPTLVLQRLASDGDLAGYLNTLRTKAKIQRNPVQSSLNPDASQPSETRVTRNGRGRIAVINVEKVFRASPLFEERINRLKEDQKKLDSNFRELIEDIRSLESAAKSLSPAKSENEEARRVLMELIAKKKVRHAQGVKDARTELIKREAETYLMIYQQIQSEIERYSNENGIELVLRVAEGQSTVSLSSTDLTNSKLKNPQDVLKRINQHVVFVKGAGVEGQTDITNAIIQRLRGRRMK